MLEGVVLTVVEAKAGDGVTLSAGSMRYRYERVTHPNHTCGQAKPLQPEEQVLVLNETHTSLMVRRVSGPCECKFLVHDPLGAP